MASDWTELLDLLGTPVPCARCGQALPACELVETTEPAGVVGYGLDDQDGPWFVLHEVVWVCGPCAAGGG